MNKLFIVFLGGVVIPVLSLLVVFTPIYLFCVVSQMAATLSMDNWNILDWSVPARGIVFSISLLLFLPVYATVLNGFIGEVSKDE